VLGGTIVGDVLFLEARIPVRSLLPVRRVVSDIRLPETVFAASQDLAQ
jgi:hypothetical protein